MGTLLNLESGLELRVQHNDTLSPRLQDSAQNDVSETSIAQL